MKLISIYFDLILLVYITDCFLYAQSGWFWQNPIPQGNTLYDIHITDNNAAFAVGDNGTFMRSFDGGMTWDYQFQILEDIRYLSSTYFIDDSIGWAIGIRDLSYASVDEVIILNTTDSGELWNIQFADTNTNLNSIFFLNPDTGWAIGSERKANQEMILYQTNDGGTTWGKKNTGNFGFGTTLSSLYFIDANTGWVAVGYPWWDGSFGPGIILKTTDGGSSWTINSIGSLGNLKSLFFTDIYNGWAVGVRNTDNRDEGIIATTNNGGITWTLRTYPGYYFTSVYFTDNEHGWLSGVKRGDDNDWNNLYGLILTTSNGGITWDSLLVETSPGLYSLSFQNDLGIAVGGLGSIVTSANSGLTWASNSKTTEWLKSVRFIDNNNGCIVGNSGTILKTSDGGDSWELKGQNSSYNFNDVTYLNENTVLAVGNSYVMTDSVWQTNSLILRSINSGATWDSISGGWNYDLRSIYFIDPDTGFVIGNRYIGWGVPEDIVFRTTDGGGTWDSVFLEGQYHFNDICFFDSQTGFITGYKGSYISKKGMLFKTIDGGVTWTIADSSFDNIDLQLHELSALQFVSSDIAYVIGYEYCFDCATTSKVIKSTDGGNTWNLVFSVYADDYQDIFFVDTNIGWVVGSQIYKTENGGLDWIVQPTGGLPFLNSSFFIDQNTGWAVGYNGQIFKTTTGGNVTSIKVRVVDYAQPSKTSLYQNYPNPFNPTTTIEFSLPNIEYVTLVVYNILGEKVATLASEKLAAGSYKYQWDGSGLASGVYFYRLETKNGFIQTKKLILLK